MVTFDDGFMEEIEREALANLQVRYYRVFDRVAGRPPEEVKQALVREMDGAIATEDLGSSIAAISSGERVVVIRSRE
jgi:2,3-bisphosphoglycerate-independent phosphoglycerate mutase